MRNVLRRNLYRKQKHILCSIKCGEARETADDEKIWRMRVACYISKATLAHAHTHSHAPSHPQTRAHREMRCSTRTVSRTRLNITFIRTSTVVFVTEIGQYKVKFNMLFTTDYNSSPGISNFTANLFS